MRKVITGYKENGLDSSVILRNVQYSTGYSGVVLRSGRVEGDLLKPPKYARVYFHVYFSLSYVNIWKTQRVLCILHLLC